MFYSLSVTGGLALLLRQVLRVDRVPTHGEGKGGWRLQLEGFVRRGAFRVIQGAQRVRLESRNHSWVSFLSEVRPEESAEALHFSQVNKFC